jgi:O-antigen/teichoic acid export membrane protein
VFEVLKSPPANSLRARLTLGALWSLAGAAVSQGSLLVGSVISARLLGPSGFGELAIINGTVGMFGVFAGFGLLMTATKYVAELRANDRERAGRIIAMCFVAALVSGGLISLALLVCAPFLAAHTLGAPHLAVEIRIASLLLVLNALNGAQTGALSGLEAFKAIARANVVRGVISLPLTAGGVVLWGLRGGVWALVLAAAVACLINNRFLSDECHRAAVPIRYGSIGSERRLLWDFSLPAFLSGAMVAPAGWVATAMLVNQPGGYGEMGIFNAANQWRTSLVFLPGLIGQVVLPIMSSLQKAGTVSSVRRLVLGSIVINGLFTVPVLVVLLPTAGWIMSFYGGGFSHRAAVLQTSVLSAALLAIQTPIGNLIAAYGRMWIGFFMNAGWALSLLLVVHILLGRGWGADAVACGYLIAYAIHASWTFWFAAAMLRSPNTDSRRTGVVPIESRYV